MLWTFELEYFDMVLVQCRCYGLSIEGKMSGGNIFERCLPSDP